MNKKFLSFILVAAGALLFVGGVFMLSVTPVKAQCGAQASSCKDCHETQGQDPVNNDGTTWHTEHAFGDFCYLCHAGNNQSTDEAAAHTGMVDPLTDIVASCQGCHPNDYESLAQGYADTLGVQVGAGAANPTAVPGQATEVAPAATAVVNVPAADMMDYSQRYDEVVLGKEPLNIGNIIAIVIIAALALGGGFFVARREGWIKISFQETKVIQGSYPEDVVDMVPEIAKLSSTARKNLRKVLSEPSTASELFALVSKLIKKPEDPAKEATPEDEHTQIQ